MLRRTEQLFRQVLRHIDTSLDALNSERDLLCKKKTPRTKELASVERVTAKLDELALSIEFELHLKERPTTLQSQEAARTECEQLFEPTKRQVHTTSHSNESLAGLDKPNAFEARLEAWFGSISDSEEYES
jgi:hypothetical protein